MIWMTAHTELQAHLYTYILLYQSNGNLILYIIYTHCYWRSEICIFLSCSEEFDDPRGQSLIKESLASRNFCFPKHDFMKFREFPKKS